MQRTRKLGEKERCCGRVGIRGGRIDTAQKGEAEVSRARCGAGRVRVERDVLSEPEIQETSARHAINGILASGIRPSPGRWAICLPAGLVTLARIRHRSILLSLFDPTRPWKDFLPLEDASASFSARHSTAFTHPLQNKPHNTVTMIIFKVRTHRYTLHAARCAQLPRLPSRIG
jgi:hypothetical protein